VNEVDSLVCPKCGGQMLILSFIEDPEVTHALQNNPKQPYIVRSFAYDVFFLDIQLSNSCTTSCKKRVLINWNGDRHDGECWICNLYTARDIRLGDGWTGWRTFSNLAEVPVLRPINEDGTSGKEIPDGEIGEIFYHPPIVFLGYYNMHEETAKAISKKSILYTGDLGYFKDMDSYRALYLAGRRKFVTKQKGSNVFPDEVE